MGISRRGEVAFFNFVCCVIVIFVHSLSGLELKLSTAGGQVFNALSLIFQFAFNGFIFLSGLRLFLNRYDKMTFDTFYVNRFVLILLPYLVFFVLYYISISLAENASFDLNAALISLAAGYFAPDMHFIPVLFQLYIIMPMLAPLLKKANPTVVLAVFFVISAVFAYLGTDYPIMAKLFPKYLVFFAGGAVSAIYYKSFKKILRTKKAIITSGFFITLVLYEITAFFAVPQLESLGLMLYSVGAIMFLFMIATVASDKYYLTNFFFNQINRTSYFLFLSHGLILRIGDIAIYDHLKLTSTSQIYGTRLFFGFIVTFIVSISWRYIRNVFTLKLDN